MVAVWIILALVAVIWLILATPLRIFLSYSDGALHFRLKYGLLPLFDSDKPPKEQAPKKKQVKSTKKKSSGAMEKLLDFLGLSDIASISNVKKAIRSYGVANLIRTVHEAIIRLFAKIFKLAKKGVFKEFDLRIAVGDSDAADAALQYGQVCAAVYPLITYLKSCMKFRKPNVEIRCDYSLEHTEINFEGQLNYRPWHFICFGAGMIFDYLKILIKRRTTT